MAIDTAGPRCAAALVDPGGRLLAVRDPEIGRGHAEQLMPLVAEVLREAGAAWRDLGRIVVAVGPGSFTGLRVGVAAARGLALTLDIPATGVSTLEALAEPVRGEGSVLAAIDARRGELYAAVFGPDDAVLRAPAAVPTDALPAFLGDDIRPAVLVGSGAPLASDLLSGFHGLIANPEGRVDPVALARVALRRSPGEAPRPLYLRGADAKPQAASGLARLASVPSALPSGHGPA